MNESPRAGKKILRAGGHGVHSGTARDGGAPIGVEIEAASECALDLGGLAGADGDGAFQAAGKGVHAARVRVKETDRLGAFAAALASKSSGSNSRPECTANQADDRCRVSSP